jgi:5-methylcytosine-specific restriction endonuclease McrA
VKRALIAVGAAVLWLILAVLWVAWAICVCLLVQRRRSRRKLIPDFPNLTRMARWRSRRPRPAPVRQRVQRTAAERAALVELLRRRDGDACQLCGYPLDFYVPQSHPDAEEVDHIVPFSRGGDCHVDNFQLAHRDCNQSKGADWGPVGSDRLAPREATGPLRPLADFGPPPEVVAGTTPGAREVVGLSHDPVPYGAGVSLEALGDGCRAHPLVLVVSHQGYTLERHIA